MEVSENSTLAPSYILYKPSTLPLLYLKSVRTFAVTGPLHTFEEAVHSPMLSAPGFTSTGINMEEMLCRTIMAVGCHAMGKDKDAAKSDGIPVWNAVTAPSFL